MEIREMYVMDMDIFFPNAHVQLLGGRTLDGEHYIEYSY